jgi:putative ABC transport system ATP-binding protein
VLLQSGNLLEHLSVADNIGIARALAGRTDRAAVQLLNEVGLEGRANASPSTLSGGEAARAGLAVALANDPPVLLADEPTGEVDEANEGLILELLRRRADSGSALVIVTHSERVASEADRVVRLVDGTVVDG